MSRGKRSSQTTKFDSFSKKTKLTPEHASGCDDSSCTGCEVGEIEVIFTTEDGHSDEPTPFDFLNMALEESFKESSHEHGGGVAKRLFDMALEGFEKLITKEEENVTLKGKEKELQHPNTAKQTIYRQYALCCISFGTYMPLVEYIRKGIDIYKKIVAEDDSFGEDWIGLGRGEIVLARIERKTSRDKQHDIDTDDDSEEQNSLSEVEISHYTFGIKAFDKGLSILKLGDKNKYIMETIHVAKDLQEYGCLINKPKYSDNAQIIYTQAIAYLEDAYNAYPEILDRDDFARGIWGLCLFYLSKIRYAKSTNNDYEEAKSTLNLAIVKLYTSSETNTYTEMLGQAYIYKSTIESEDTRAIEAFDLGVEFLLKAYHVDKENEHLREQLEILGALNNHEN